MTIFREIFRGTNGDLSSKRIFGATCILMSIIILVLSMFLIVNPIHESILIAVGTLMTGGLGLLGVSVKEKKIEGYGEQSIKLNKDEQDIV